MQKKEYELDLSELDLASNLSSSTELEKDTEQLENDSLRRSKKLTKTNPIVRLNNPVNQSDYRKHSKTTEPATTPRTTRRNAGAKRRGRPLNHPKNITSPQPEKQHASHGTPEKTSPDHGRNTEHNHIMDSNGYTNPLDDSPPITEGGM